MRSKSVRFWVLLISFLGLTAFSVERYVENTHYKRVAGAAATGDQSVIEFFSYGCPHCRIVEPEFEAWIKNKPDGVTVTRVPATWNAKFASLAQMYYALEEMGVVEQHNARIFKAIHEENKALNTRDEQAAFLSTLGVDAKKYVEMYDGKKVADKMKDAARQFERYRVSGVPGFVVNGVYFTDVSMGGHGREIFDVINFLISKH